MISTFLICSIITPPTGLQASYYLALKFQRPVRRFQRHRAMSLASAPEICFVVSLRSDFMAPYRTVTTLATSVMNIVEF